MSRTRLWSPLAVALSLLVVGYAVFLWVLATQAQAHPADPSCPQETPVGATTVPADEGTTAPDDEGIRDEACPQQPTTSESNGAAVVVCVGQTGGGAIRVIAKNGDVRVHVNGTPGGSRELVGAARDADLEIPRPGPRFHERLRAEVEEFERDLKAEIRANTDGGAFSGACETAPFEEE